jgi:hypothetical protein
METTLQWLILNYTITLLKILYVFLLQLSWKTVVKAII